MTKPDINDMTEVTPPTGCPLCRMQWAGMYSPLKLEKRMIWNNFLINNNGKKKTIDLHECL